MNKFNIPEYVTRYLETTDSRIYEQSEAHVTVQLSPDADRALTNRPYYWNFVERTGAEAETMTFTFIFDQDEYQASSQALTDHTAGADHTLKQQTDQQTEASTELGVGTGIGTGESILERYFGIDPGRTAHQAPGRPLEEKITYGCGRLQQIFAHTRHAGQFVTLYEQPPTGVNLREQVHTEMPASYQSWLGVNYKVELSCDMKRSEIHSLAIHLSTGEIVEQFQEQIMSRHLLPNIPAHAHIRETISLPRAVVDLENYLARKISAYDHTWAEEAMERYNEEYRRIETYYNALLEQSEDIAKSEEQQTHTKQLQTQLSDKIQEIERQYKPRVQISVINCGLFHLF